ncbi:SRPBCC family protein [Tsuneonella sp. CC-YZS046]|uniref:SRPBCC family protein n=1 Tax=Tsuneonella sp. CC-YZS046 TaxID=3042152 RepID=UPI002D796DFE|nr:SRPBCC family protein [Tsuneonella sp. CC-YZS046]WRO66193.1 SRPBCC family protein [Tsuneonella sp. CC-YZS046]
MKEETTFTLNISPLRVWTCLSDLHAFAIWHPSYRFEDSAALHRGMGLSFALFKGEYRINTTATITRHEKPRVIGWSIAVRGLEVLDEQYELEASGLGTQIRHTLEFNGFLGRLLGRLLRRGLRQTLHLQDRAFVKFLKKEAQGGLSGINRHRRRAQSARAARKATHG